jgi:hypothetical protein
MRSILTKSLFGALAGVLLTAGTAAAADMLEAKVPFPFVVNGKSFPAGEYRIERATDSSSVFLIRSENGNRTAVLVGTRPAGEHSPTSDMPSLQFKKHENEYRLTAVWETPNEGFDLMK